MRGCSGDRVKGVGWSLLALLAALMLLRGRRSASALPSSQAGFVFAPALLSGKGKDPYFANVSLLIHADGVDGGTVFTDSSSYGRAIARSGDAATTSLRKKFGSASMSSTQGGQARLTMASSAALVMGAGDFTYEMFVYLNGGSSSLRNLGGQENNTATAGRWFLGINSSGKLSLWVNGNEFIAAGSALTLNQWLHVAVSRSAGTTRLFVDGAVVASAADANNYSAAIDFRIGSSGSSSVTGNLDEVRLTKGVGRYTAAFTPPSSAFPDA